MAKLYNKIKDVFMKLYWSDYFKVVAIVTLFLIESIVIIPLIFIHPAFATIFIASMFNFMILIYDEPYIPDFLHMSRKMEYTIDDSYVFVKMLPGVWVKTEYHVKSMEEFIEKKVDYQHRLKETFKV